MIVIVSNRSINIDADDETAFGEEPNPKGLDELRIATAKYSKTKKKWKVELLSEKSTDVAGGTPPSRQLFLSIMKDIRIGKLSGNWIVFVHGFNQSFQKNLEKCRAIEELYGINVLAFSWPSNQGGFKPNEYKKARAAARGCTNAFDRLLEKLSNYLSNRPFASDCKIHLNLMCYSLGNYVFENLVRAPIFTGETKIFENVLLTQADVDVDTHSEWVKHLSYSKRVYVTINENDSVLKWSDVVNPDRLGNTVRQLNVEDVVYFDFTDADHVGDTHGLFYKSAKKNPQLKDVFERALTGGRAERADGLIYQSASNTYTLSKQS